MPTITCLMTTHMNPFVRQGIEAVVSQTRTDAQIILVDSGRWICKSDELSKFLAKVYRDYKNHPLIEWVFTGESEDMHKSVCMVGYIFNKVFEEDLVKGKYFCTSYDEDLYHPQFFEKMAGYLDSHPQSMAVMCIEKHTKVNKDGEAIDNGKIDPKGPRSGENFAGEIDGMQVMFRTKLLKILEKPYLAEDTTNCSMSDGLFLNKVGMATQVDYLPEILCEHRATPFSNFAPTVSYKDQTPENRIAIFKKLFRKSKAK